MLKPAPALLGGVLAVLFSYWANSYGCADADGRLLVLAALAE